MNIYGVRGYPTPDFTDERHCRTFSIPNTTIALAVFMGALWTLADEKNWQQYGDMTPSEAAEMFQDVIWSAYEDDFGICPAIEAPYWDTYDNADDEEPEGDPETWYGELVPVASMGALLLDDDLTWRENIGIWAIAGFIAYSGQIGAAIAFVPFARRFVLKFRGNPLGAIAEIFIDGAKLATLDTASAEDRIQAIDIQLPDDDEHEIWVAVGEDSPEGSTLQVVRKELSPSEVYPTNLRYNSDCDCTQQTYDGGETWVDQPAADPRHNTAYQFPPIVSDDPRCQAAANMSLFFENLIGTALGVLAAGLDILGVATAIMPVFIELGPFAILFDIGLGLGSGLISLGVTVINSEFTPEVYDLLTCIFYCAIEDDGSVTAADLADIISKIADDLNPDVELIMGLCFLLMGEVGLSNAGTTGEAPADCDECGCEWCYEWDFTVSDGGFTPVVISGLDFANYSSGIGWTPRIQEDGCTQHAYVYIAKAFGFATSLIGTLEYDLATALGSFDANSVAPYLGGTELLGYNFTNGTGVTHVATIPGINMDTMKISLNKCSQPSGFTIQKMRAKGFGDMPAFTGGSVCA